LPVTFITTKIAPEAGPAPAFGVFGALAALRGGRRRSSTGGFDLGAFPDEESAQVRDSSSIRRWHIACSWIGL